MRQRPINEEFKTRLNAAFKALRKQGFLARQSFLCCGGCAWSEADFIIKNKPGKYSAVVFYHKQDAEGLRAIQPKLFLAFGIASEEENEPARKTVGEIIVQEMQKQGLKVEWDGDTDTRILVSLNIS